MQNKNCQERACISLQEQLDQELQETFKGLSLIENIDEIAVWKEQFIQTVQNLGYLPA